MLHEHQARNVGRENISIKIYAGYVPADNISQGKF